MPALPLSEAIERARDAIGGGNYRTAVETCRRVLDQYPDCAAAYQLLGEAALEQRDVAEAERAFQEALRRDPQNLAAYLGLGVVAEERVDTQRSLAYFQAAWEIQPQRTDLRDHVVRLSQRVYGSEGRLVLTRAALASLHYLARRWSRAVAESAAVLAEHPTRVDVRLRLAEALWRRGEDVRAVAVCRQVLEQTPQAIGALVIMATIERERGNEAEAAKLRDQVRALDPLGARAAELLASAVPDGLVFFVPAEAPTLEDRAAPAPEPEVRRIAPAPDFIAPLPEECPAPTPSDAAAATPTLSLATDAELTAARPGDGPGEYGDVLRSLEDTGLEPFRAPDFATGPASASASAPTEVAPSDDLAALFQMPSDDELAAARPPEAAVHGYTALLHSLEDTGLHPFTAEDAAEETGESDGAAVADEVTQDEAPAPEAEPILAAVSEAQQVPAAEAGTEPAPLAAVDWDAIDDEIRRAIPGDMPHGYTEELRSLDATGVEPFAFEGEDIPFFQRMRPGRPAAAEEPPANVVAEPPAAPLLSSEDEVLDLDALERLDEPPVDRVAAEVPSSLLEDTVAEPAAAAGPAPVAAGEPEAAALDEDVEIAVPAAEAPAPIEPAEEPVDVEVPASAGAGIDAAAVDDAAAPLPGEELEAEVASVQIAVDRLGIGTELFERARAGKAELVGTGRIDGSRSLADDEPAVEPVAAAAAPVPAESTPDAVDDPAARLAAADSLLDRGEMAAALEEYRWIYRHEPALGDRLIPGLTRIAASGDGAATVHRLLGAIYRRRGDVQLATRHYALSLSQERPLAGRRP